MAQEMSQEQGCLMWGNRVIIPPTLQVSVLNRLHEPHLGETRMKALGRSYFWWPHMDDNIINHVKCCLVCQSTQRKQKQFPTSWPPTDRNFQRVNIDYLKFDGQDILVLFDNHSKWIDAWVVKKTNAESTICKLESIFLVFGSPEELICDNGPPFTSAQFLDYLE